jgi:hypothetical protein
MTSDQLWLPIQRSSATVHLIHYTSTNKFHRIRSRLPSLACPSPCRLQLAPCAPINSTYINVPADASRTSPAHMPRVTAVNVCQPAYRGTHECHDILNTNACLHLRWNYRVKWPLFFKAPRQYIILLINMQGVSKRALQL